MESDFSSERLKKDFHHRWFDEKRLVLITPKGSKHLTISRRFQLTIVWLVSITVLVACILGGSSLFFYHQQRQLTEKTQKVEQDLVEFSNQLQHLRTLGERDEIEPVDLPEGHVLKDSYVNNYIQNLHREMNSTTNFTVSYLENFTDYLALENANLTDQLKRVHHRLPKIAMSIVDKNAGDLGPDHINPAGVPVTPALQALQENRRAYLDVLVSNKALKKFVTLLPAGYPLDEYWKSSGFGPRKHPVTGRLQSHHGIDLVAQRRTRIKATAKGVVTFTGKTVAGGKMVFIRHAGDIETRYGHLHKIIVKKGDTIEKGDTIGLLGSSGRSTGPHVHYEVLVNKIYLNPEKVASLRRKLF